MQRNKSVADKAIFRMSTDLVDQYNSGRTTSDSMLANRSLCFTTFAILIHILSEVETCIQFYATQYLQMNGTITMYMFTV